PHPGHDLPSRQGKADGRDQAAAAAVLGDRVERSVRALRRPDLERPARGGESRAERRGGAQAARRIARMTAAALARNRYVNRYAPAALGILSLVVFIALIELLIRVGVINRFIVPMPSDIIAAFPRIIVEENVLHRFALTAGEAFSASILVTIFGVAG